MLRRIRFIQEAKRGRATGSDTVPTGFCRLNAAHSGFKPVTRSHFVPAGPVRGRSPPALSFQPSAFSSQFSVLSSQPSALSSQLSAFNHQLSVISSQLSVISFQSSALSFQLSGARASPTLPTGQSAPPPLSSGQFRPRAADRPPPEVMAGRRGNCAGGSPTPHSAPSGNISPQLLVTS
jgi:hypothetical protein